MTDLHRIGVIGTKGGQRKYIAGTPDAIELVAREDALHWDRATARILTKSFNEAFARLGRVERFQIEKAN